MIGSSFRERTWLCNYCCSLHSQISISLALILEILSNKRRLLPPDLAPTKLHQVYEVGITGKQQPFIFVIISYQVDIKNPTSLTCYVCFVGMKHRKDTTQIQNAKQKMEFNSKQCILFYAFSMALMNI